MFMFIRYYIIRTLNLLYPVYKSFCLSIYRKQEVQPKLPQITFTVYYFLCSFIAFTFCFFNFKLLKSLIKLLLDFLVQFNPINKPKGNTNNNNNSTNNNTPPENPNSPPIFNSNKRKKDDSEGDKLDQNELNRRARNNAANQKSRAKKKAAGIKRKPVPKVGELDAKGREERDKVNARTKKWRAARKENMSDQELFEHNTQVAWTSYKYRNFKGLSPDKLELEREKYFYTKSEERRQKILYDALPEYKKIELEQEKINLKKQKEHEYHRKRWADQKVEKQGIYLLDILEDI